ncbi:helix-turn-helix domain-containing protein [Paenibacillus tepidiphilus]|uniref:helix-turn-helix domain-containing protein n=1 Tax=Paenibacillus tepidiphilus TaxID=2608683 RepID=UPI00123B9B66|nr:Rgg/GadR/MutR family transcriptional regulator [Paenibacillus tepidiphilus]
MHLGATIRQVRKSKGMKQAGLAAGIMSRSNLSRFEGGEYSPGYDKLILLLDKLEMSLDELLFLHRDYVEPVKRSLHLDLAEAGNRYDLDRVKALSHECFKLYRETGTEAFHHLYLLGQSVLLRRGRRDRVAELSEIAASIKPYLLGVEQWYLYEFKLLNNFLFTFSSGDAAFFGRRGVAEFAKYRAFPESRTVQQHLMQNIAIICLRERDYAQSLYFLQQALPLADKTHLLYDKIETSIYYEITRIRLGQQESTAELDRYLLILRQLGFTDSYRALRSVCSEHGIHSLTGDAL